MDKKKTEKPLILAMSEAENELVKTINELMSKNNLPCYLFEMIFDKIHRQLKEGATGELARADRAFRQSVEDNVESEEGT